MESNHSLQAGAPSLEKLRAMPELNGYEVREQIGKGSYSTVYRSVHTASGRTVALKVMNKPLEYFYSVKQLLREVTLLRQIQKLGGGKHVVNLLDVIVPGGDISSAPAVILVLEYFDYSLADILANPRKFDLTEKTLIKIVYQLLCCLKFIHTAYVLHRDIKPQNILVDQDMNVKLCDFGMARSVQ